MMCLTHPELRQRKRAQTERIREFRRDYQHILSQSLVPAGSRSRKVLVISRRFPTIEVELTLLKALEIAGYVPVVVIKGQDRFIRKYYELAGIKQILFWADFVEPPQFLDDAKRFIAGCQSVDELLKFEYSGARVGKVVFSTVLRQCRLGSLDLESDEIRPIVEERLASAMASAVGAQKIFRKVRPELMLSVDIEYIDQGELFDVCLANGIDAIKYEVGHKSSSLMFKRYTLQNRSEHFSSLSPESWRRVREMNWTEARREELRHELRDTYATGEWFGSCSTQFNKRLMDVDEIRRSLDLDPAKKNAFIFPHIPWDSSLMWGKDLFGNYEEWLVETVRAACANDKINWVVKIHPANVGKSLKDGFAGEPSEIIALRKHFGKLPSHVFLIPAESDISTFSLFELMDYCLTVRGTIGIEAASFGIPVLTAGTGRYDRKKFTIDSDSPDQYLERIRHIQSIPRLSAAQQELAERFAYGIFLLRPLRLTAASFEFKNEATIGVDWTRSKVQTNIESRINITDRQDWRTAPDVKAFAQWVQDSGKADFLLTP